SSWPRRRRSPRLSEREIHRHRAACFLPSSATRPRWTMKETWPLRQGQRERVAFTSFRTENSASWLQTAHRLPAAEGSILWPHLLLATRARSWYLGPL